jgi:leucyl-tRNA synthetase
LALPHLGVEDERLIQLVAPMMPHLAETCWSALGRDGLVADAAWPAVDNALLVESTIVVPVQVNGKRRGEVTLPIGAPRELVEKEVLSLEAVSAANGSAPKKPLSFRSDRQCRHYAFVTADLSALPALASFAAPRRSTAITGDSSG